MTTQHLEKEDLLTSINLPVPQISGMGLKNFEDKIGYFNKQLVTDIGEMDLVDEPIDILSRKASDLIQNKVYFKTYTSQMNHLNWWERNIHLNSSKEKWLARERIKKSESKAMFTEIGIKFVGALIKFGYPLIRNSREKREFAKSVYQLMSFVSKNNNQLPTHDQTIIHRVMGSMPISKKQRRKIIKKTPIPSTLLEIEDNNHFSHYKEFIGGNIYKILKNKGLSNKKILEEQRYIFEFLGFATTRELKGFLEHTGNDYQAFLDDNFNYQNIIHQIYLGISNILKIDNQRIWKNSLYLGSYDPVKQNRERNMYLIKEGAKIGGAVAIKYLTGGADDIAVITAYSLSQNLLNDTNDKKSKELYQTAFEDLLSSKNVEKDKVLKIINEGETLTKSIYK